MANGLISTYQGTAIYKTTKEQYIEDGYYKNPNDMFIIDNLLIKNNYIIGKFDNMYRKIIPLPVEQIRKYYIEKVIAEEPVKEVMAGLIEVTGWETADDILKSVYK